MPNILNTGATSGAGDGTAAAAAPAPVAAQPTAPAMDTTSTAPATAPTVQPTTAEMYPETMENIYTRNSAPSNSFGAKIYHGILNALGGSNDVVFDRDPNTGKMIAHTVTQSRPGEQWKRIISGALTGFAGAQAAGTRGPGGTMRGLAGGIQAGAHAAQQNRTQARNEANEDYQSQLATAKSKLENSLLQQSIAKTSFEVEALKKQASDADISLYETFTKLIEDGGPNSQIVGTFGSLEEGRAAAMRDPQLMKALVNGELHFMPNIFNKERKGVIAALVTPDFENTPSTKEYKVTYGTHTEQGPDGKPQEVNDTVTLEPGTKMGTVLKWVGASQKENDLKTYHNAMADAAQTRAKAAVTTAGAAVTRASAAGIAANASYMNAQTRAGESQSLINYRMAKAAEAEDSIGDSNVDWGDGGHKEFVKWRDKQVDPVVNGVEKTYELADAAYKAYQEQQRTGQLSPTGAAAMQMFANHMQLTFGQVKGMRQGQQMMEQHLGARSIPDSIQVAINKFVNGDPLSPAQWTAFHDLITNNRNKTWEMIQRSADSRSMPYEYIAFPDDYRAAHGMPPLQRAVPRQGQGGAAAPIPARPAPAAAPAAAATPNPPNPNQPQQVFSKSAYLKAVPNGNVDAAAAAARAAGHPVVE